MNVKEIENDSKVQDWLTEKAGSRKTRDAYIIGISAFTEYIRLTPNELIQKSRAETIKSMIKTPRKTILIPMC